MKMKKLLSILLAAVLLLPNAALAASWEDFTDASTHWAAVDLQKAVTDGLLNGTDAHTLSPDAPISAAQMLAVLDRVLSATQETTVSTPAGAWYAKDIAKAAYLDLLPDGVTNYDAPLARQDALSVLARAFGIAPAAGSDAPLAAFSDAASVRELNRSAVAGLVSDGLVKGFNGSLNANGSMTRAEFVTLLYRIAGSFTQADALTDGTQAAVVRGDCALKDLSAGRLCVDCAAKNVSLTNTKLDELTLRCDALDSFTMDAASSVGTLTVALGSGSITIPAGAKISTLRLLSAPSGDIGSQFDKVEIAGRGLTVNVTGKHSALGVDGKGNTVTLAADAALSSLSVGGSGNNVTCASAVPAVTLGGSGSAVALSEGNTVSIAIGGEGSILSAAKRTFTQTVAINGTKDQLLLEGTVDKVTVNGSSAVLSGSGHISSLVLNGLGSAVTVTADATDDSGAKKAQAEKEAAEAAAKKAAEEAAAKKAAEELAAQQDVQRVLSLVTLGYRGNYTLAWAQSHDYTSVEKETWVRANGYSSSTGWLIWVNLSMQRVNIFYGSKGNWSLCYSCIVGTGASGTGTPTGIYTTTYKSAAGWTTSSYNVHPVTGFKSGTGYAFHSRLYYPNGKTMKDYSIGYPISHGCVRMYDDDCWYIYNNVPIGSTVVVY